MQPESKARLQARKWVDKCFARLCRWCKNGILRFSVVDSVVSFLRRNFMSNGRLVALTPFVCIASPSVYCHSSKLRQIATDERMAEGLKVVNMTGSPIVFTTCGNYTGLQKGGLVLQDSHPSTECQRRARIQANDGELIPRFVLFQAWYKPFIRI